MKLNPICVVISSGGLLLGSCLAGAGDYEIFFALLLSWNSVGSFRLVEMLVVEGAKELRITKHRRVLIAKHVRLVAIISPCVKGLGLVLICRIVVLDEVVANHDVVLVSDYKDVAVTLLVVVLVINQLDYDYNSSGQVFRVQFVHAFPQFA